MAARPAPRPKRGADEFARGHYKDSDNISKKPRFDVRNPSALLPDAPEEDIVLEADEIGKRGQKTKRSAVNIDGYESDSSNEGFDARADAKAREANKGTAGAGSKTEEQDDMFADLEDDFADGGADDDKNGKKAKNVKFVEVDDIEGQVDASKSGGHVSANFSLNGTGARMERDDEVESSSESEVGDEERAGLDGDMDAELGAGSKKRHAPKLDAFNLNAEKEEGGFDEQLNYVRKAADPDALHDTWLEGVSKKDMRRAREAQRQRDEERWQKDLQDDSLLTPDILKRLIPQLERSETVLEALARLGRGKEKKKPKWQIKAKSKRSGNMDVDVARESEDPAETKRQNTIETITTAADLLLSRGHSDIYDTDRNLLRRMYERETGEDWVEPVVTPEPERERRWEYRWSDARDGGGIHGPYDGPTMVAWRDAGYFGEGVEFRIVGGDEEWKAEIDF